jgi:hypothetical protein
LLAIRTGKSKGKIMSDSKERTLPEKIGTWVQIVGILIATGWGAYTFIYKEITIPRSAPINISINLDLKKVNSNDQLHPPSMISVEMQVSLKNPSSRKVDLLPSVWVAYGYSIGETEAVSNDSFATIATSTLKKNIGCIERGYANIAGDILSTGRLFQDDRLKPNETITRSQILHIPVNTYDVLRVACYFPSAADASNIEVEWGVNSVGELVDTWYHKDKNGQRRKLSQNELDQINKPPIEAQYSHSVSELALR